MNEDRFESLCKNWLSFRDERDWAQFHTVKNLLISLTSETGELCQLFNWKSNEEALKTDKEKVADELSDILGHLILISETFNINLLDAADKKLDKNRIKYPVEKAKGKNLKYSDL